MGWKLELKILLIGHGRHGKDTVAEILSRDWNLSFRSSSEFCAEHVVYPALKNQYGYTTVEECFLDRHKHRSEWYDLISEYCKEDASKLGREIFSASDIYCGLRNKREFHALKNGDHFDVSIWIDRSDHLPPEDRSSNNIEPWMADYIIDNNGTLEQLHQEVTRLMNRLISEKVMNRLLMGV